jgi:group I intron endonuclease
MPSFVVPLGESGPDTCTSRTDVLPSYKRVLLSTLLQENARRTRPKPMPKHIPITVRTEGETRSFKRMSDAARVYRRRYATVRTRIRTLGWTAEQALGLAPPPTKKLPATSMAVAFTHAGETYRFESLNQAARAFGVRPQTAHKLYKKHQSFPQALGLDPVEKRYKGKGKPVSFTHKGVLHRYPSRKAAAVANSVNPGTCDSRMRLGMNIQQALGLNPRSKTSKSCAAFIYLVTHRASGQKYVGQTMLSSIQKRWDFHVSDSATADPSARGLHAAINRFGSKAFSIEELEKVSSKHEADTRERHWIRELNTKHPNGFNIYAGGGGTRDGKPIWVGGKRYPSIASAARSHNVDEALAAQRLREQKWTPEQAFGLTPPPERKNSRKPVTVPINGVDKHFPSKSAAARERGLCPKAVSARTTQGGWSIEQALDLVDPPRRKPTRTKPVVFRYKNKRYAYVSFTEAAKRHGMDRRRASARFHKLGWTYAEALGIAPRQSAMALGRS